MAWVWGIRRFTHGEQRRTGFLSFILASGACAQESPKPPIPTQPLLTKGLKFPATKSYIYHYSTQSNAVMTGREIDSKIVISKLPIEKNNYAPQANETEVPLRFRTEQKNSLIQNLNVVLEIQPVISKIIGDKIHVIRMRIISAEIQNETAKGIEKSKLDGEYLRFLQFPIYFTQNQTGTIERIYKQADEPSEITNFKRGIISAFQTRMISPQTTMRSLSVKALDKEPMGEIELEYDPASLDKAGNIVIKKAWTESSYTKPLAPEANSTPMKMGDATLQGTQKTLINPKEGLISQVDIQVSMQSRKVVDPKAPLPSQGIDTQTDIQASGSLKLVSSKSATAAVFTPKGYIASDLLMEPVSADQEDEAIPGLEAADETFQTYRQAMFMERLRTDASMAEKLVIQIQNPDVPLQQRMEWTGILAQEGSPHSQKALADSLLSDPSLPSEIREYALTSLVLIENPIAELKDAASALLEEPQPEVRRAAATALGAMIQAPTAEVRGDHAHHLSQLHHYLKRPWSEDELLVAISALGNAGHRDSLNMLAPYLEHTSNRVRMEAVEALRKMKDDQASLLLLDRAQLDESPAIRHQASLLLNLEHATTPATRSTVLNRTWQKQLGSGSVYGKLHGKIYITQSPFHLEANAMATGYAFGYSKTLIKAEVKGDVTGSSNAQKFSVNGGLYVVGNKVWNYSDSFACNIAREKTWGNNYNFFTISTSIPIFGPLSVHLGAGMNGSAHFKARGELNGCAITSAFAKATLTPRVTVGAYAQAGLSLAIIRGGLRFQANLINGSMPSMFSGTLSTNGFQARGDVDLVLNPLSAKLDVWYQWRKWKPFKFYWGGGNSWTVWSWSLPNKTWHVLDVRVP